MGSSGPWLRLLRIEEYGPLFALCPAAGFLLAGGSQWVELAVLVGSVTAFSASAFVVNDIYDAAQDSLDKKTRNPVARREIGRAGASALFGLLVAFSAALLLLLPFRTLYLALPAFGLVWGYSWAPGFRKMPVLDVLVHGVVPALYFLMGFELTVSLTAGAVGLSAVIFLFSAATCLLQEVRDTGPDSLFRNTTVSLLGEKRSVSLAILLSSAGVALYVVCALYGVIPPVMVLFAAAAPLLLRPLFLLLSGRMSAQDAMVRLRRRGTGLAVAMMVAYIILR